MQMKLQQPLSYAACKCNGVLKRSAIGDADDNIVAGCYGIKVGKSILCSVETELETLERKQKIQQRWQSSDAAYIQAHKVYQTSLKHVLLSQMQRQAQDLQYLISLRKKYPGNQIESFC